MSYSQPPPPPPSGGYGYGGYARPQTSQKAVWSLVVGIISLLCCGLFGIASIILGSSAKKEIDASNGFLSGRGMAQAGFVLGIIAVIWFVLALVLFAGGVLSMPSGTTSP